MEAYAVIETGGKQYRVEKGAVLDIERVDAEVGTEVTMDRVLALSDGSALTVGTPQVEGGRVTVKVLEHFQGAKLFSFKRKRRKGYKRKVGHRQERTKIQVLGLSGNGDDPDLSSGRVEEKVNADVQPSADSAQTREIQPEGEK